VSLLDSSYLEPCFICEKPDCDIFIRARVGERLHTVAVCDTHWNERHPGQEPIRFKPQWVGVLPHDIPSGE